MKTIKDYFKKKEGKVLETISLDLSGITGFGELVNSLHDYFERYWYSEFEFYFTDKYDELNRISMYCPNGYETDINLCLNGTLVCKVNDAEKASKQIEKLVIENN